MLVGANQNESISLIVGGMFGTASGALPKGPSQPGPPVPDGMGCPPGESAMARAVINVPVWRYLFANNKPGSSTGAKHGEDVPYVFGNGTGISKLFQNAWATFAKDPEKGLSKLNWPTYNTKGKATEI
jgi:cholinesterase